MSRETPCERAERYARNMAAIVAAEAEHRAWKAGELKCTCCGCSTFVSYRDELPERILPRVLFVVRAS